jgi:hypothetical protein
LRFIGRLGATIFAVVVVVVPGMRTGGWHEPYLGCLRTALRVPDVEEEMQARDGDASAAGKEGELVPGEGEREVALPVLAPHISISLFGAGCMVELAFTILVIAIVTRVVVLLALLAPPVFATLLPAGTSIPIVILPPGGVGSEAASHRQTHHRFRD